MQLAPENFFNLEDFVPDLRKQFEECPAAVKQLLRVAIPVKQLDEHAGPVPAGEDRRYVCISDGREYWHWEVDSLRALFRGDRQPPVLGDYPDVYNECFLLLDLHVLEISEIFGDRRDAEVREVYSALRRRPDGRSLGFVHDYLWQAAALVLGTRPLSQAEFAAIMARLERSCRTFETSPGSRNYVAAMRSTLGQAFRPR